MIGREVFASYDAGFANLRRSWKEKLDKIGLPSPEVASSAASGHDETNPSPANQIALHTIVLYVPWVQLIHTSTHNLKLFTLAIDEIRAL